MSRQRSAAFLLCVGPTNANMAELKRFFKPTVFPRMARDDRRMLHLQRKCLKEWHAPSEKIRTASEIPIEVDLRDGDAVPVYMSPHGSGEKASAKPLCAEGDLVKTS